ncbi:endonuclease/exonuclease/phosphatase family protein [Williamsia sp. MIQD14]|uniref:endonuclease/exonuclease/phosphatase family protein n=1 Tax=Williamsia sp. MIQD14 TaxID=3425703 RepID=UPI003D9FF8B1
MDRTPEITVATWNTAWATVGSRRGQLIRQRLTDTDADVLVVTEGRRGLLAEGGHVADGGDDWGYGRERDRRKVLLWSQQPLTDVERITTGAGAGRVVTAMTTTPAGPIRVLAVCIPWSNAHVSTGRKDAAVWSEHLECLDHIEALVSGLDADIPVVIAGDMNQRVPRVRQPVRVASRLAEVLGRWTVHTAGDVEHGPLIDHVASDLTCAGLRTWSGTSPEVRLSDHSGVMCTLTRA